MKRCVWSGQQLTGNELKNYEVSEDRKTIICPNCKRTLKLRRGLKSMRFYMIPTHNKETI